MSPSDVDFSASRAAMVDGQLRPNRVFDAGVVDAMRTLPRERFLPAGVQARAYADEDVPLPGGRCLMEPMVLARLVQAAAPRAGERVLVVGAGTGYGAAVAAACGASVVALEEDPELARTARRLLAEFAPTAQLVEGPLVGGWPAQAPYDLAIIEGGFEILPADVVAQLRPEGGRLAGVQVGADGLEQIVLGERLGGVTELALRPVFDCATPVLPALRRAPGFRF